MMGGGVLHQPTNLMGGGATPKNLKKWLSCILCCRHKVLSFLYRGNVFIFRLLGPLTPILDPLDAPDVVQRPLKKSQLGALPFDISRLSCLLCMLVLLLATDCNSTAGKEGLFQRIGVTCVVLKKNTQVLCIHGDVVLDLCCPRLSDRATCLLCQAPERYRYGRAVVSKSLLSPLPPITPPAPTPPPCWPTPETLLEIVQEIWGSYKTLFQKKTHCYCTYSQATTLLFIGSVDIWRKRTEPNVCCAYRQWRTHL